MTTPCCVARRSVSTCACFRQASTRWQHPTAWLVTPQISLTRGARLPARRHSQLPTKVGKSALNYGMQEVTLAARLGVPVAIAKELMSDYMNTYPAVEAFFEEAVEDAREYGYSWTVLGRKRFLPDIASHIFSFRKRAERQAVNTAIQGSAADVVKLAMMRCYYDGDLENRFDCKLILQIHDELVFEMPEDAVAEAGQVIKELMEHSLPEDLAVPLSTSVGIGNNWFETH